MRTHLFVLLFCTGLLAAHVAGQSPDTGGNDHERQQPRASSQWQPPRDPAKPEPGLSAEYLYHGVNRPVIITVVSPRSFGTVLLQLMDFDGRPLAPAVSVFPGRVDLSEKLPAIWDIRRTAYLQMIDINQPVGSALVLQPMLSRMVPQTQVRPHPVTGRPSTRIVDWVDENDPSLLEPAAPPQPNHAPPPVATTSAPPTRTEDRPPPATGSYLPPAASSASAPRTQREDAPTTSTTPAASSAQANGATDESATASDQATPPAADTLPASPPPRLFTGLRIYPERDVLLKTSRGEIRIALKPDEAPNTAWNFLELARGGFYRGVTFHRIVPLTANGLPFVIQAGDPTATGDGGPGYWLPIEDSKLPHDFGVISMARSDDPDSNGSQFFICLSREGTARLDGQYCAFGYAVDGAQTIRIIAESELADVRAGRPKDPPVILEALAIPAPPRAPGVGRPDARVTVEQAQRRPTTPSTGRVPR